MMFDLSGKTVLVVGGRGYLGRDFCQKLRTQNATVISADQPHLSKAASKADYDGDLNSIHQLDIDVTDRKSINEAVNNIKTEYGTLDVLVFSVTAKPDDFYLPFTECSLEGWQSVIRVELDGLFMVAQEVGKLMESQQQGSMVFISSIYGVVGNDQRIYQGSNLSQLYGNDSTDDAHRQIYSHSVYPAVKGGVISLSRYLAAYWGEKNIRVNCVSPGGVSHEGENDQFVTKYSDKVPLGRKAKVEEISGAIVFLASDESSYVTGQNMIVDGGWTTW